MSSSLMLVILLALVFEFINGMRGASNIVATMISSRAFSPRSALGITAAAEFIAPFLFGVTVARTIGSDIVSARLLTLTVLIACLGGAIIWNFITWFFGIPSGSSHALFGSLIGAVMVSAGWEAVKPGGLYKILIGLFASPVIGFIVGFLVLRLIYFLARQATPNINNFFRRGQFATAVGLAFSYGTNDAQKTMGIITLGLVIAGIKDSFDAPFWVILLSISITVLGTLFGGWRLIRTLGGKFYKIRPVHSFSTQLASAAVILSASSVGLPASTTQVVSSAIIGVGASERLGKVRWSVADDILTAWVLTIPASGLFGAGIYWLIVNLA